MSCAGDAPPARRDQEVERQYDALAAVPQGESSLGAPRELGEVQVGAPREQDQMAAALQRLGLPQVVVRLGGSTAVLQRGVVSALAQVVVRQDTEEAGMGGNRGVLAPRRLDMDDPEVLLLQGDDL